MKNVADGTDRCGFCDRSQWLGFGINQLVTAVGSAANQMKSVAMVWYQYVSDCSGFCCQSDEVSGYGLVSIC
jgi:hypothetical protein